VRVSDRGAGRGAGGEARVHGVMGSGQWQRRRERGEGTLGFPDSAWSLGHIGPLRFWAILSLF